MSIESTTNTNTLLANQLDTVNDTARTNNDRSVQNEQTTQTTKWQSVKNAFKKIAKFFGVTSTFAGTSAVAMAVYSIATSIATVGFCAALTPVLPLLLGGTALAAVGIAVYKCFGGGNISDLSGVVISGALQGASNAHQGNTANLQNVVSNVIHQTKDYTGQVIQEDKNLQQLYNNATKAIDDIAKGIQKLQTGKGGIKDIKDLLMDRKIQQNLMAFGRDLLDIKNEVLPSNGTGIISTAFDKLMEAKQKIEDLKQKIINSQAGQTLKLEELEKQLTEAFTTGKLQENPLETIKNALVDTGSKILADALNENVDIKPEVFKEVFQNLTSGNAQGLMDNLKGLAQEINEKSAGWFSNYLDTSSLPNGIKSNINNLIKMYAELKANQPLLLQNILNGDADIKAMFSNITKNAMPMVYANIIQTCDIKNLIDNINAIKTGVNDRIEEAKAQIRTLTDALYNCGQRYATGTYFNIDNNDILNDTIKQNLNALKDLMSNLKTEAQNIFNELFTNNGSNNESAHYLGQYLYYFGTGDAQNKTI